MIKPKTGLGVRLSFKTEQWFKQPCWGLQFAFIAWAETSIELPFAQEYVFFFSLLVLKGIRTGHILKLFSRGRRRQMEVNGALCASRRPYGSRAVLKFSQCPRVTNRSKHQLINSVQSKYPKPSLHPFLASCCFLFFWRILFIFRFGAAKTLCYHTKGCEGPAAACGILSRLPLAIPTRRMDGI